jgi:hypothetical protein
MPATSGRCPRSSTHPEPAPTTTDAASTATPTPPPPATSPTASLGFCTTACKRESATTKPRPSHPTSRSLLDFYRTCDVYPPEGVTPHRSAAVVTAPRPVPTFDRVPMGRPLGKWPSRWRPGANKALHIIATTRMRDDPATKAYLERRRKQGKATGRSVAASRRYIARQLFRALTTAMNPNTTTSA